jgi:integrase
MRAQVARIVAVDDYVAAVTDPTDDEALALSSIGEDVAPAGMHYLYDDHTQAIIEPAFLYLYAMFGPDGRIEDEEADDAEIRRRPTQSNRAAAYELAEWLRFLSFTRRRWDKADHELIAVYAHHLSTNISAHSRKRRGKPTISHKLSTVYGFYNFTNAAGISDVKWDRAAIRARYRAAKKERRLSDDEIRPFADADLIRMQVRLGPLPSERPVGNLKPCRERLLLETGILTGMRGEEIVYLSAPAIKRLKPDLNAPDATQPLRIYVTKAKDHRTVALPNKLIHELQLYIGQERAEAVAELTKRGGKDHGRVFVNLAGGRSSGAAITTNTIHRRFFRLMVDVGRTRVGTRIVKGEKERCTEALHSFHDTRHYYAVNLYKSLRDDNEASPLNPPHREPWRIVQVMLGHSDWATTRLYYLRWVGGEWEATASERTHDYLED